MSKIYKFKGNGDNQMEVMSRKTYEALRKVVDSQTERIVARLSSGMVKHMRSKVKGGATLSKEQLLIKYLKQTI
jgi:hypothetical protein